MIWDILDERVGEEWRDYEYGYGYRTKAQLIEDLLWEIDANSNTIKTNVRCWFKYQRERMGNV